MDLVFNFFFLVLNNKRLLEAGQASLSALELSEKSPFQSSTRSQHQHQLIQRRTGSTNLWVTVSLKFLRLGQVIKL